MCVCVCVCVCVCIYRRSPSEQANKFSAGNKTQ